jgi:hypothetical protein
MREKTDQVNAEPVKKRYAKPEVKQVSLRPEEAVLGSCKTNAISGPAQAKCGLPSACSALAS